MVVDPGRPQDLLVAPGRPTQIKALSVLLLVNQHQVSVCFWVLCVQGPVLLDGKVVGRDPVHHRVTLAYIVTWNVGD